MLKFTEKSMQYLGQQANLPPHTDLGVMDDYTKSSGKPTSQIFAVILCNPNFVVS